MLNNQTILITGAMVPFSIDSIEANANFSMALGYLLDANKKGVFIAMHGLVNEHKKIFKNRDIGVFQSTKSTTCKE